MSTTKLLAPVGSANTTIQTEYGSYTVASDLTVTVDSRAVASLEKSGYTVFDDDLPIGKELKGGKHTVTSGEASAHTCAIVSGLATVVAFNVMILRGGKDFTNAAAISETAGTITVADNSTDFVLTAADVIHWIALGAE